MPPADTDPLVRDLRDLVGDDLRVVATYTRAGYDPEYVRDGVESRVDELGPEIHEELVLQGLGEEYLEQLFDAGELHCSMHRLDDVTIFHFIDGDHSGLFVSVDSSSDLPLKTFAERCRDFLD